MKKRQRWIAILASTILLSACATQGPPEKIQETFPRGEVITLVVHDQQVPDWWLDRNQLKLNYLVKGGEVSQEQLAAIAKTEKMCQLFTGKVRPSNLVAVVSSGVIYALAGATGLYFGTAAMAGATQAYRNQSAEYGAYASGTGGVANGLITLGGQTYTFENCGREVLASMPGYEVKVLQKSPY